MACLSRTYHFKSFKGCLPHILLGPFLKTLTQMLVVCKEKVYLSTIMKRICRTFNMVHLHDVSIIYVQNQPEWYQKINFLKLGKFSRLVPNDKMNVKMVKING